MPLRIFLSLFLILLPFAIPVNVDAAQSCDCYCESSEGAIQVGSSLSDYSACRSSCDTRDSRFLGCYTDAQENSKPENNELCWSRAECLSDQYNGVPSDWGGQEGFCKKGSGYCYIPSGLNADGSSDSSVSLGVAIGNLKEVSDISVYIAAVYNFLLIAASTVAILMIMIAGVQWAMAGGNPGTVEKAKDRIGKAVIGLILLLSAFTIARMLDPALTEFGLFRVPKIKTVIFLSGSSSCDVLQDNGIKVKGIKGECGDKGIVEDVSGASKGNLSVGVDVGDECRWTKCVDISESCVATPTGSKPYTCLSCTDIYDGSPNGVKPSELTCGRATSQWTVEKAEKDGGYAACEFYDAADAIFIPINTCVEIVYPKTANQKYLDCDDLRVDAEKLGHEGCRMYDLVYSASDTVIGGSAKNELDWLPGRGNGFSIFEGVCEADPCNVGYPNGSKCEAVITNSDDGFCKADVISSSLFCQTVSRLTYTANCYDKQYAEEYAELVKLYDRGNFSDISRVIDLYRNIAPTDVNGKKTVDVNW